MIAYIDSSVLMRVVLREPDALAEWGALAHGVTSVITKIESHRAIDRLWHHEQLSEDDVAEKRLILSAFLPRFDIRDLDAAVIEIASKPLPVPLRTLDAIHLATAMLYRRMQPPDERPIVFATHDVALARAAAAMHFEVIGVSH